MKNEMFLALIILAVVPASAQGTKSSQCSAKGDAVAVLAQNYAARIDGLLRDVHARLQNISASVEGGRLTAEQGQRLKRAAARDIISRLDAMAAIYEARLDSASAADKEADKQIDAIVRSNRTVSVEELRRERVSADLQPCAREATR